MLIQAVSQAPGNFFTLSSFATLAGATGIVYVVCGGIQRAFNFSPKWFALVVSMLVSFIAASFIAEKQNDSISISIWIKYLIAFLNGFLIYMTATGTNQVISSSPLNNGNQPNPQTISPQQNRKFGSNWWR